MRRTVSGISILSSAEFRRGGLGVFARVHVDVASKRASERESPGDVARVASKQQRIFRLKLDGGSAGSVDLAVLDECGEGEYECASEFL